MKIAAKVVLLLALSLPVMAGDAYEFCVVCKQRIALTVYLHTNPYLDGKQPVCASCVKFENECFVCNLPVTNRFTDLKDGRFLCERDTKEGVLTMEAAEPLFEEMRRDVITLFGREGKFPGENIELSLADRPVLERLQRVQYFPHPIHSTLGLTRTRKKKEGGLTHEIHILSGLRRSRFVAVAAHEYAHAWLQENVPDDRAIDSDTVEGFCELVAYRLTQQRNMAVESNIILSNDYTRGQIHVFLEVEPTRFYETVKWMKRGVDTRLETNKASRIFALNSEPNGGRPGWNIPSAAATSVPDTLKLRNISGPPGRPFVMINNQTLALNEQARVRVGSSNVLLRCVEIKGDSAIVQLLDSGERRTLRLEK